MRNETQSLHVTLVCYGGFLIYTLSLASLSVRSSVMALNASISMRASAEALPTVTFRDAFLLASDAQHQPDNAEDGQSAPPGEKPSEEPL